MRKTLLATATALLVFPIVAMAAVFDTSNLPYSDVNAQWDLRTRLAVSFLTDEGVLLGNDDGTFAPFRNLNRAEFMTIVMRTREDLDDDRRFNVRCFPDVPADRWYTVSICRAKDMGIVHGNDYPGLSRDRWPFEPNDNVQYEEALKVLVLLYDVPLGDSGRQWYETYLNAAINEDLELPEARPGDKLTRAQMARLTAGFVAWSRGDLDDYRDAERASSSSRTSSSRTSSSSSRTSSTSSSSSSFSGTTDPDEDISMRSRVVLLGEDSPVMAKATVFLSTEPFEVTDIDVVLDAEAESVDSFAVYRTDDGAFLGRATRTSDPTVYTLGLSGNPRFEIPQRVEGAFYVRARLRGESQGGASGEDIQIDRITVHGTGVWSNDEYSKSSSETFPAFVSARARIRTVENAGNATDILVPGMQQLLASFRISGEQSDALAGVNLEELRFTMAATSGVSVSNVEIRSEDSSVESSCSVASSTITCSSIPAGIGEIDDDTRVIRIYGDVALSGGLTSGSLQISLNETGNASSQGAITWNDEFESFDWVDLDQSPIVRGTLFSR